MLQLAAPSSKEESLLGFLCKKKMHMTDLGLYGALAYYGCISYNISHFSVSIVSHLFSPHTIIQGAEENPNRVMTGTFFVLAS